MKSDMLQVFLYLFEIIPDDRHPIFSPCNSRDDLPVLYNEITNPIVLMHVKQLTRIVKKTPKTC